MSLPGGPPTGFGNYCPLHTVSDNPRDGHAHTSTLLGNGAEKEGDKRKTWAEILKLKLKITCGTSLSAVFLMLNA